MENLIVHIGFGKTASGHLQKNVFPKLLERIDYDYFLSDQWLEKDIQYAYYNRLIGNLIYKIFLKKKITRINFPNKFFISSEGLSSYRDANLIEEYAEGNLKAFGEDAHIILVIREPRSWLTSIYLQLCHSETPYINPEDFFLSNQNYSERLPNMKWNVDKFSYEKVINHYKKRFKKFTYIKYEELNKMEFISDIFDKIDEKTINELKDSYNSKKVNKGFSKFSAKLNKFIQNKLEIIGLGLVHKYSSNVILKRASNKFVNHEKKNENIEKNNLKIFSRIKYIFSRKNIFQNVVDKIIKYEKFELDFDKIKVIKIEKLKKEYNKLENFYTFIK